MGSFSIFHWLVGVLPFLILTIGGYVLYRILKKPTNETVNFVQPGTTTTIPATLNENQQEKIKWIASGGYIFVLVDAFLTQLLGFYQFNLFGFLVCLLTLVPFIIFYSINKSHEQPIVVIHLKSAIRIYVFYASWSVINGILLSGVGTNLIYALLGVGISIFMLGVLVWLAVRCGQGIVSAFKLYMPSTTPQDARPQESQP